MPDQKLLAVPRATSRTQLGFADALPFHGCDVWNTWELSWLDRRGKPTAYVGQIVVPASSPQLMESKSLKLYLNSFNQTRMESALDVQDKMARDLATLTGAPVEVSLWPAADAPQVLADLPGECIDDQDVEMESYHVDPILLAIGDENVEETLHSHLLRSNCPITNQPDWGSVLVHYRGPRIETASLLRYLVSYRCHQDFHEACVERMFGDIAAHCQTTALTVQAFYTRRGGIDINPFRSDFEDRPQKLRLRRQ